MLTCPPRRGVGGAQEFRGSWLPSPSLQATLSLSYCAGTAETSPIVTRLRSQRMKCWPWLRRSVTMATTPSDAWAHAAGRRWGQAGPNSDMCCPLWAALLVCSGCHDQVPQTGWLKKQTFISQGSGGWMSKVRVWAVMLPPEASLLGV